MQDALVERKKIVHQEKIDEAERKREQKLKEKEHEAFVKEMKKKYPIFGHWTGYKSWKSNKTWKCSVHIDIQIDDFEQLKWACPLCLNEGIPFVREIFNNGEEA